MEKQFRLRLITPVSVSFEGSAISVVCPGAEGRFQVLVNHAPLLATLDVGEMDIDTPNGERIAFAVGGGVAQVLRNEVLILANSAERREKIDVSRAEAAKIRAEERLAKPVPDIDLDRARAALYRAINRLRIAGGQ